MDFGIMFFSSVSRQEASERYGFVLAASRLADARGFSSVWTPERHFHPFGGLFPNPSVLSAALAMVTERIALRAGSLVSPLHDVLRIAEEWSVVDNLSRGRVAISFGSGWNVDDFVFYPERYADRQATMYRQIQAVQALWRGERLRRPATGGREAEVELYPKPVQPVLPVWVTSSGNAETFAGAGRIGANLLTHLLGQDLEQLERKVRRYREARREAGFDPAAGVVTLMLHTFLGHDRREVEARVRQPFREYLRSATSLEQLAAQGGGAISGGHRVEPQEIPPPVMEDLLDVAFDRYFDTASLMGTPEECEARVEAFAEAGVDEIACLIDFIDDAAAALASLELVAELRARCARPAIRAAALNAVSGFLDELET